MSELASVDPRPLHSRTMLGHVADPVRMRIIALLARRADSATALAQLVGLHRTTMSIHCENLRSVGLVKRVGLTRSSSYALTDAGRTLVAPALALIAAVAALEGGDSC